MEYLRIMIFNYEDSVNYTGVIEGFPGIAQGTTKDEVQRKLTEAYVGYHAKVKKDKTFKNEVTLIKEKHRYITDLDIIVAVRDVELT